jgi:NAD(P)-dependent dehydrogenase (short-subunit alcohol dehydrogenase family)
MIVSTSFFDLTGKVALVTGGGLGIGRGIAVGLAAHGADVLLCDLHQDDLDETARRIAASGTRCVTTIANIGKADDIHALFALLDKEFGKIDILVNNVGIGARFHPEDLPMERFKEVLELGVFGSFLCAQEAGKRMIAAGTKGSIINISSIAGAVALGRGNLAHSVNKGAINSMTRELAVEWAHHGIRVNAILPCQVLTEGFQTWLDSPQFDQKMMDRFLTGIPMNRLATAEDMAGPAVFLASDAAAMVTGTLLGVDGGNLALNAGGSHTWTTT